MIFLVLIWIIAGPLLLIPVVLLALFAIVSLISGRKLHGALKTAPPWRTGGRILLSKLCAGFTRSNLWRWSRLCSAVMKSFSCSRPTVFQLSQINSIVQGIGATFSQVAVVTFAAIGSLSVISGDLTVGALAAGTMLSGRVLQPGLKAMGLWSQFQSLRLARRKVEQLHALKMEQGEGIKRRVNL